MPEAKAGAGKRTGAVLLSWAGGVLAGIAFFGLALRLALPGVAAFRGDVEALLSGYLSRIGHIESIEARFAGWTPWLIARGVTLYDDSGSAPILRLAEAQIAVDVAASLRHATLSPRSITLVTPELRLVRRADGRITIEGIAAEDDRVLRRLLANPRTRVLAGRVIGHDEKTGHGPFTLTGLRLDLERRDDSQRLRLSATGHGPLPRRIELALEARGDVLSTGWQGEVYAEADGLDPGLLMDYGRPFGLAEASGRLRLKLWSSWQDGRITGAAGRLWVRSLELSLGSTPWRVRHAMTWFGVNFNEAGGADLTLDRLRGITARGPWPETRLRLSFGPPEGERPGTWLVECGYLRIEDILPLVLHFTPLDVEHRVVLERAAASGELRDLRLVYRPEPAALFAHMDLRGADLRGIAAEPLPGRMRLSGLYASVDLEADRGRLVLPGAALELGSPALFDAPWAIERLAGEITWRREGSAWRFEAHDLEATIPGFEAEADGHLDFGPGSSPFADLRLELSRGDVARVPRYLPRATPPALREWLQRALVAGRIVGGSLSLRGPLDRFPFDRQSGDEQSGDGQAGRFFAHIDVDQGILDHTPGWPRIEDIAARVVFQGRSLEVHASRGRIAGARLEDTQVRIADLGRPVLEIRGLATGPAGAGRRFLLDSPLAAIAGDAVRRLTIEGGMTVGLTLDLPLGPAPPTVSGRVSLPGNTIEALGFAFSDVKGQIGFGGGRYGAEGLSARVFGRPVTIDLSGGEGLASRIRIAGRADPAFIQGRMGEFLPAFADPAWLRTLDGDTDLEIATAIPGGDGAGPGEITIRSSLEGLSIRAPAPIGKSAGVKRPIEIATRPGAEGRSFRFRYGDVASGDIILAGTPTPRRLERLLVRLGAAERVPPPNARSWVGGSVSRLSLSEWRRFLDALPGGAVDDARGGHRPAWPLPAIDIEVADLEAFGLDLGYLGIRAKPESAAYTVALHGERARGTLRIPAWSPRAALEARFEHLSLLRDEKTGPAEIRDPRRLPGLIFECRRCSYGPTELGSVRLKTRPGAEGLSIYDVGVDAPAFDLEAVGIWQGDGGRTSSRFDIELKSPEIGAMLHAFGYTVPIEGGKCDLEVHARWPGSPADFTFDTLNGTLELRVREGRFLEVEQGVGRLFGLLSLHALQRRLRLDFTDLFGTGFAFDRIEGRFDIGEGDAYTHDLVMEGPSARIDISGRTGLVRRDYDQSVTVTPAIAGTLPLAGALFGPAGLGAGAAVLLAQEVFSEIPERINKVLERRYQVTGSWDRPVVTRSGGAH